jgi:polysaccharide deacetylase 2 family uncharacterized protein YibQ
VAVQFPGTRQIGGLLTGWRGLGRFWIAVLSVIAIGAVVLQTLGPPPGPDGIAISSMVQTDPLPAERGAADAKAQGASAPGSASPAGPKLQAASQPERPGRDIPGPIADPDPSLLEPYPGGGDLKLPRISVDGRKPMTAYAAAYDPSSVRPRVGMLVAGIGMSVSDSMAAIKNLPGGVTLAISPYAADVGRLLDLARMTEHEYLLSVPMEPQGYPANDPDDRHALMTSLPPAENLDRLRWVLARLTGYVGITSALGPMRGERLSGVPDQLAAALEEAGHRGLLFVDARTNQPVLPNAWNRSVDVVIDDDPVDATVLDQRLDALNRRALDKGSALGVVWVPRPVTLARVAAWTNTLAAKGLALAPVSALMLPPAKQEAGK